MPAEPPSDWARPIVHWEIEARDPERQRAFYRDVFNWNIGDGPIMNVEAGIGGPEPGPAGHIRAGSMSRVTLYIQVADLADTMRRVEVHGGLVTGESFDIPDGPTLAFIEDPELNPIVLVQQ